EETCSRFIRCFVVAVHYQLGLQRVEEAFHRRIVPTVPFAAHALADLMSTNEIQVNRRRISRASIRVHDVGHPASVIAISSASAAGLPPSERLVPHPTIARE